MGVGIANTTAAVTAGNYVGVNTNSLGYHTSGRTFGTDATTGLVTYGSGDTIGVEVVGTTCKFYKNGTLIRTCPTIPTGTILPEITLSTTNAALTANFGATAFSSLPSGATAWDGGAAGGVVSGAGSSAGTNTATAVGAWLQSGVGSSAGSNTTTATAAWLQSGVGSSAGTDTASGVGSDLQAGTGSAAGSNTATAVGALAPVWCRQCNWHQYGSRVFGCRIKCRFIRWLEYRHSGRCVGSGWRRVFCRI
jgi:hypothetical protein